VIYKATSLSLVLIFWDLVFSVPTSTLSALLLPVKATLSLMM